MLTGPPPPSGGGITNATVTSSHTARSPFCGGATTTPLPSKMSPNMLHDGGYLKQKPSSPRQYCFQGSALCGALLAVCATALATIPSDNTSDNALHDRTCIFLDCHGALAVCNGLQRCQCVLRQVIRLGVGRIASRLHVVPEGLNCAGDDSTEIGISISWVISSATSRGMPSSTTQHAPQRSSARASCTSCSTADGVFPCTL